MEFKESLDILLQECRYIRNEKELDRLIPGASRYLPPFMAVRYADKRAPKFKWGFPIVPGQHHLLHFQRLFHGVTDKALSKSKYKEELHALSPEQFKQDAYLKEVSSLLIQTLAEGAFLKLDTVYWLYLADLLSKRFNLDNDLKKLTCSLLPQEANRLHSFDEEVGRIKHRETTRFGDLRQSILHSVLARHEYAWRTVKEVFDEVPANPIAQAMLNHRMVFVVPRDGLYQGGHFKEAFAVRNYRLKADSFETVRNLFRAIFIGLLERRKAGRLYPVDGYLLRLIDLELATEKALSSVPQMVLNRSPEIRDSAILQSTVDYLSLQAEPCRYLFYHLDECAKYLIKPIERKLKIDKEQLRAFRDPRRVVAMEAAYQEITDDILRWDFFNTLLKHVHWVHNQGGALTSSGRPLSDKTVPINLGAVHQVYRRSRHGTVVFFDLIGFTDRTKTLSKKPEASNPGEERAKFSLLSLAIQRLFSVRRHLEAYGGSPQGFEGDAILDIFPKALNALRYVARFADNYEDNRLLRFRPFEGPASNPYQDGWRVGLASGPYTVISLVGRSNEMSPDAVHERAVGHTVNRASRLNSGKKGERILHLGDGAFEAKTEEIYDPLEIFRVKVDGKFKLNNNGICSFEETFQELILQLKRAELPHVIAGQSQSQAILGEIPAFQHYDFELIYQDPDIKKVILVRRLPREPQLKGLEDENCVVFEYVFCNHEQFLDLLEKDKALGERPKFDPVGALGPLDPKGIGALQDLERQGLTPSEIVLMEEGVDPNPNESGELAPSKEPAGNAQPLEEHPPEQQTWEVATSAEGTRGAEALDLLSQNVTLPGGDASLLDLSTDGEAPAVEDLGFLVDPFAHDGAAISIFETAQPPNTTDRPAPILSSTPPPATQPTPDLTPPEPIPSPPSPPQELYLEKDDLEGYGYALEEANGPDQAPSAILVGCPRGDTLQDCHRYEPSMFEAHAWDLDAVLKVFVLELDGELREGSSRGNHKMDPQQQIYLLDSAYLFSLAQGEN